MKYLNLGCGYRFHPDWTNIDFISTGEGVIARNLTEGIPFADCTFDAVYQSHVLEHLSKIEAESLVKECYRVLRPQGILRMVVPDLEQIARIYLTALEQASSGSQEWVANYEWILLEMYDQTVRNHAGGEILTYLSRSNIPNQEFILKRWGVEAKNLLEIASQQDRLEPTHKDGIKQFLQPIYRFIRYPSYRKEVILKSILGKEYKHLQIGRFRQSGEVHQWMYDRYSLALLLEKCGLTNILQRSASESYIPNWPSFNLDTNSDGTVYKPDSLFMEATKP